MAAYFLDTSALVKRHVTEPGHTWVQNICDPANGNVIVISETAIVEVTAGLSRMTRERPRRLSIAHRDRLLAYFERLVTAEYTVVQINRAVITRATTLCRTHPLRAYDAMQLACVLIRRDDDLANGQPAPIFVCADMALNAVALTEGLSSEDPNDHP